MSVAVDRLTKKGYLYGERDLTDRRIVHLKVTENANDTIDSILNEYQQFIDALFFGFTEEEKEIWQLLEKRMSVNIENALKKKN